MSVEARLADARPERLLVIVAHPDDAEFGIAGSVARWVREGTTAHLVCCTSGDAGGDDPLTDPLELAAVREAEQRSAAAIVGYSGLTFLHRPDGALRNDLALREQLVRIIRTVRPDAVATPDPRVLFHASGHVQHVDHREAGMAAVDAVFPAARNAMAFPHLAVHEGLEPHVVGRLYLFWSSDPDVCVDISATLDRKLEALRAHRSQLRDPVALEERVRGWAREAGQRAGVAAAEALRVMDVG
jgi:LmbE family N-acetylglucosaminyl deacetylase